MSSSLISALIVTCDGERYAIPQTAVDEIIRMNPDRDQDPFRTLNGQTIYQLRELVLPVVSLARVLNGPAASVGAKTAASWSSCNSANNCSGSRWTRFSAWRRSSSARSRPS